MKSSMKLKALIVAIAVGYVSNIAAETASDSVNVYAGLMPALELTCSDVHFGVWRVPVRTGGTATTIALTAGVFTDSSYASLTAVTGNTSGVAQSVIFDEAQVGTCVATGSRTPTSTAGSATFSGDVSAISLSAITNSSEYTFGAINAPTSPDPLSLSYTLGISPVAPLLNAGEATFAITGTLNIPADISVADYGGYKSDASITVTFTDAE